jgi:hypothetical protein
MTTAPLLSELRLPREMPSHPRLLARPADWERARRLSVEDPAGRRVFAALSRKAERFAQDAPETRQKIGFRLLSVSRRVLEKVGTWAVVARLDGGPQYAERAVRELEAICRFEDWNPGHFLDVAEMALAVAIGYDWLFDRLTEPQRAEIRRALVDKALLPSFDDKMWWITGNNNWNQVCHAGMVAAAIAVADHEPELAEKIIRRAVENLSFSAAVYAPDGAYPEGPMYWNYGTSFHVVLVAALEAFFGHSWGTDAYPGFGASGLYAVLTTAPSGNLFCYADCRLHRHLLIPSFWMARHFRHPEWVAAEARNIGSFLDRYDRGDFDDSNYRLLSLLLFWLEPGTDGPLPPLPLHWLGRGSNPIALHRSAHGDPRALFAAIKGGSPSVSHGHMDVGSFLLEADGVRWALDLGMQDYETLESKNVDLWDRSQNGTGWTIFRLGPESHNIPRFNEVLPDIKGSAPIEVHEASGPSGFSVVDLETLYPGQVAAARRGLWLSEGAAVLLQDEWTAADRPVDYRWQWLTSAEVTEVEDGLLLSQDGETLRLLLPEKKGISVRIRPVQELMQPFDAPNPGVKRIEVSLSTSAGASACLRVWAVPGSSGVRPVPAFRALKDWSLAR